MKSLSKIEINLFTILMILIAILILCIIIVKIRKEHKKLRFMSKNNLFMLDLFKKEFNKEKVNYKNSFLIINIKDYKDLKKNLNQKGIEKYINAFIKKIDKIFNYKVIIIFDISVESFIIYMPYEVSDLHMLSIYHEIHKYALEGISISNRLKIRRNINAFGLSTEEKITYKDFKANIDKYINHLMKQEVSDFKYLNLNELTIQLEKEL